MTQAVPCPNCGELADAGKDNGWRPFCSRRCKLIDLGEWLTEEHRIPGRPEPGASHEDDDSSGYARH